MYGSGCPGGCPAYPLIPVTRKWRLPWILVQFLKLSMFRASTVCRLARPVPKHTERGQRQSTPPVTRRVLTREELTPETQRHIAQGLRRSVKHLLDRALHTAHTSSLPSSPPPSCPWGSCSHRSSRPPRSSLWRRNTEMNHHGYTRTDRGKGSAWTSGLRYSQG